MTRTALASLLMAVLLAAPLADARPKKGKAPKNTPATDVIQAPLLDLVKEVYAELEWTPTPVQGDTGLRIQYVNDTSEWAFYVAERPDDRVLLFYSVFPQKVPAERRADVAEFVARANWGMRVGNFEIDMRDGEVRYKTAMDISEGVLTKGMVKDLIAANVFTAGRYLPGVQAVSFGGATAEVAIQKIEAPVQK